MQFPQILPVPLKRAKEPFDHSDWLFELKYDGFRALAYLEAGNCRLVSRRRNVFKSFAKLSSALPADIACGDAIIDGEIVCLDDEGRAQFDQLFHRRDTPSFVAFDLLWLNGRDLRERPLIERKRILRRLVPSDSSCVLFAESVEQHGTKLFRVICGQDLEGIVAKRKDSRYTPERSDWIKIKNPAYTRAEGRRERFEKRYGQVASR